jgi:nucleoid DNA-binding protein
MNKFGKTEKTGLSGFGSFRVESRKERNMKI